MDQTRTKARRGTTRKSARARGETLSLALLLLLLLCSVADAQTTLHHDLEVALSPATRSLIGKDEITVRPGSAKRLEMLLAPGAKLLGVTSGGKPLAHEFSKGVLRADLPRPSVPDGAVAVRVEYRASFPGEPPQAPTSSDDPSYGVSGTLSERGTFLSMGALWHPLVPDQRPTWKLTVTAPEGVLAVSEGRKIGHSTERGLSVSRWDVLHPLEGLSLSAGRFQVRESGGPAPQQYYALTTAELADGYLKASADYLKLYSELFGPYPFAKWAVVENFYPTGFGFASWTLIGGQVLRLPFIVNVSLPHEIAHNWWGNGVLVDYSRGNWSEGLATYSADYLLKERASPKEARDYRLQTLRNYAALVSQGEDFPLREFRGRHGGSTQSVGYGKAMFAFHEVRRRIGDEAFFGALQDMTRTFLFREAAWDDFASAFTARAGQDFKPFLAQWTAQWLDKPGAPAIRLEDVRSARTEGGWEVSGKLVQTAPAWRLMVPLRLETEKESADLTVEMVSETTLFRFSSKNRPTRLVLDPESHLFRRLSPDEIPPTVNSVRGSDALTVVVAAGLSPDAALVLRELPASLGQSKAPVVTEAEADPGRLSGRDLLFLGVPARPELVALLPPGSFSSTTFEAEGNRYDRPGDSLFLVNRRPDDPTRVSALFLPLSPQAAEASFRKIQHYGRFGLLTFRDGQVDARTTAPAKTIEVVFPAP